MRRIAIKRLGVSDLTYFQAFFERHREALRAEGQKWSGQKAWNLDRRPFIDEFFPGLDATDGNLDVEILLLGPGDAAPLPIKGQKIGKEQKNWRLHGATIKSPDNDPSRFDGLEPGDLAVMVFLGEDAPDAVQICLIPQGDPLYGLVYALGPGDSKGGLVPFPLEELERIVSDSACPPDHPLKDPIFWDAIEQGPVPVEASESAPARLVRPSMTKEELDHRNRQQTLNGEYGEKLVNAHFMRLKAAGAIQDFEWVSQKNPTAPYDFKLATASADGAGSAIHLVDVKSTSASCNTRFHVSMGEVREMAKADSYLIYRVHSVQKDSGILTVFKGVGDIARRLMYEVIDHLPIGVSADDWIMDPRQLGLEIIEEGIELSLD